MISVSGIGMPTAFSADLLAQMRLQLEELQRQLGSGKKTDTYAGLGLDSGLDITVRAHLSRFDSYEDTISSVTLRTRIQEMTLGRMGDIGKETRSEALLRTTYELVSNGQTEAQRATLYRFDEILSLLNEKAGDHFLFSGRATDSPATESSQHILDGNGAAAGLRQVMAERLQADQGADGRGRLLAPAVVGTLVTLEEDGTHPFGFKLSSLTSDIAGATVTPPAGSPATASIDLGAVNPVEGAKVHIELTLPDGTSAVFDLTASSAVPAPADSFAIGASVADTATNLGAAIDAKIQYLAKTELAAASTMAAAENFFNIDASNPPQRVDGPPFDTATALIDATASNTVHWYVGDDATDDPRMTAIARVDDAITVNYGVRANEEGIRNIVQHLAAFAAQTFLPADPDAKERYAALIQRLGAALGPPAGVQKIEAIRISIAGASLAASAAKGRLADKRPVLEGMLGSIENISPEEVAAKLLALSTNLQATMQTTAMLAKLSLVNYI